MSLGPLVALLLVTTVAPAPQGAYGLSSTAPATAADSVRPGAEASSRADRRTNTALGAVIPGYLSSRGLPPLAGQFVLTDSGLVFASADGRRRETFPLVGPVRVSGGRRWRAAAVTLAYVDQERDRTLYVFRLDGGVFQTERPGALLEVLDRPAWVDSLASLDWPADRPLVDPRDGAAIGAVTARLLAGSYADTLHALFGRPTRPVGRVGPRGRRAGRLGEYLAPRDSLTLDPARMVSEEQLRHTLAHELAHRWQARAPRQLAVLWQDIPAIRDDRRYGHGSVTEHQAEAVAFAVHYLQATAASGADPGPLLEQYERMVPGTSLMARYLALQPIYARHPLRPLLTRGTQH